jgi:phage terminase small subunit
MPPTLTKRARPIWEELLPHCAYMGTVSAADARAFAMLCELEAKADQAKRKADPLPLIRLAETLRKFYEKFGLDPQSRSRIQVRKPDAPASKWSDKLA